MDRQVEPRSCTERPERMKTHQSLRLLAPSKDLTVRKSKFSPFQSQTQALYSVSFLTPAAGSFSGPPRASFCRSHGPGKVTLMPPSSNSFALHRPLAGCEARFFRLQNGKKSLLLPQDASRFLPENCYSYPNALNKIIKRLKGSRERNWLKSRELGRPKGQGRGWRCPLAAALGSEPPRHHLPLTRETHHGFERRAWKRNKSSRSEGLQSAH